ncbi:hypothetical protein A500_04606 [Clostridium sartagoforme AAU1]|uniref:Core-binding (CB) domain-containing protein n=1 Tax=Clostridium sartagoforme AAU1 TaxID=1202534 RepID=R9CDH0_9CLOT|nr:type I restriction enzyme HsdR N-terminal domain-containing protein [Clostridium sartagoforme]EOR27394.1 hypothetical protein A500_04606 [Clostridium sartagoforme AAU1]
MKDKEIICSEKLNQISQQYLNLPFDSTEEDLKIKVVIDMLELLGYSRNLMKFERSDLLKKRTDIYITYKDISIYVEIKRKNHDLTLIDFDQLVSYLNRNGCEWGILTNGDYYYLFNNKLEKIENKVVFIYKLIYEWKHCHNKDNNNRFLKYLHIDNLIKKKSTHYFYYYCLYSSNCKLPIKSLKQYESAIFDFFDYLNENHIICDDTLLSSSRLEEYLDYLAENGLKDNTLLNKGRYISSFIKYLEDKNSRILSSKNFTNYNIENYIEKKDSSYNEIKPITTDEINKLFTYYSKLDDFSYIRNKLLFEFFIYSCPSIETIKEMKMTDITITSDKATISINGFEYTLPENIRKDFIKYKDLRKMKKINCPYVFYVLYNGKYQSMGTVTINNIINVSFSKLDGLSEERKKELGIRNIQKSTILRMIDNGFSLDELYLLTGNSVSSLFKFLDKSTLKERSKSLNRKLLNNKHPYSDVL